MKKLLSVALLLALFGAWPASAQEPAQPAPAQEPPQDAPPPPPEPPPRVIGQARSQAELDAYNAIDQAATLDEKYRLAEQFLQQYPDSGLTSYVHLSLANSYRMANDNEKFIDHAEKTLTELPNLPDMLSYLAFLYAEMGRDEQARLRAQQALSVLENMPQPSNLSASDWARSQNRSRGDAYYALGRVHFGRSLKLEGEAARSALDSAIADLVKSSQHDPDNPYATFRLGQAYTNRQRLEEAIEAYARTVAMGGVIGPYARKGLERVYEHVHQSKDGMEEMVAEEREKLQAIRAAREKEYAELDAAAIPEPAPAEPETPVKPPGMR